MKKIIVIGSIAIDNVTYTHNLPVPGMTVYGDSFLSNIGGKGANQACAIKFLGGDVKFYGAVGDDVNGKTVQNYLKSQELQAFLKISHKNTGVANIIVDEQNGENRIVVVPGANMDLNKEDIDKIPFSEADILLLQLENNIDSVEYAIKKVKDAGLLVVLNPAPYHEIPKRVFPLIDYFIPNEHELEQFTPEVNGDYEVRAKALLDQGIKNIIVTLGEKGSYFLNKDEFFLVNPYKVEAIDTTGAGDTFCGAFVTALSKGKSVQESMDFASKASSITVTRKGAIASLPKLNELE